MASLFPPSAIPSQFSCLLTALGAGRCTHQGYCSLQRFTNGCRNLRQGNHIYGISGQPITTTLLLDASLITPILEKRKWAQRKTGDTLIRNRAPNSLLQSLPSLL